VEVVASLSQGRTAAAQCGLFTYKSDPVIFEPPCTSDMSLKFKPDVRYLLRMPCYLSKVVLINHVYLFIDASSTSEYCPVINNSE